MSIRLRLTLWYTTVLAIVVICFGAALYYLLTFTLINTVDRQLESTAAQVASSARLRLSSLSLEMMVEVPNLDMLATPGLYIQVYDSRTGQAMRSLTLGEGALPLTDEMQASAFADHRDRRTVMIGGAALRVHSVPLTVAEQVVGIVQVGTSLAQVDQTQRQLLGILVAGSVVAIVLSAGLGALLARSALQPIDEITQTALSISRTEDLKQRLEVKEPADEISRLAQTFNEMLARLETLFHTQQRFIADVSHELRTPLTIIQGNLDLLQRKVVDDPESHNDMLAATADEVSRMSRLVADLLLLARVDAGVRLEMRPVELDTLLLEVYRQATVMSSGVEIRLGHEDQAVVLGDADRLRQLFLNLVDNALKYTPDGGEVALSLYNEGGWVRVTVEDTGIGIPPADLQPAPNGLPSIFERFYRADPARTRGKGGTGLGLSIAHWITEAHGGEISVESTLGEGSTFAVRLPAVV